MSAQIIQAADAFRSRAAAVKLIDELTDARLSDTARNSRIRETRKAAWQATEAKMRFYQAMAKFLLAIGVARRHLVPDAMRLDDSIERFSEAREAERRAWEELLFLPVPDQAALKWKQSQRGNVPQAWEADFEIVLADDHAFLTAHPIKRPRRPGSGKPGPMPRR